jgi:transposase
MPKHSKNSPTRKSPGKRVRSAASRRAVALLAVGMDLGDRHSEFCVLEGGDTVHSEGRLRTTELGMREFFERLAPARVAIETGTHSGWVSRLVATCGHEVVVANARELRKIHQSNHKNDRADARILARMVRFDPQLLSPIVHRSAEMQADTALLRTREALVSTRARLTNTARGLVKAAGGRLPSCSTDSFARQMRGHIPAEIQGAILPLVTMVETLGQQIRACDERIAELARKRYPQAALLEQIAGVGTLTAVAFILALADKQRFARSRDVGPYLGLVPRQADSGERSPQLGITKAGNPYMRRLLVGSAQYILGPFGPDTDLRRHGLRLAQRGGKNAKKRAVVAVARKLAVLMHRLWVTGEVYDPLRNTKLQPQSIAV